MNDKPSDRVSTKPPVPSIAPPTDDIDADWGADDAALPAPLSEPAAVAPPTDVRTAPPSTPRPLLTPLPHPSSSPFATRSFTPAPRAVAPSSPPAPSSPSVAPRIPTPLPRPSAAPRPSTAARSPSVPAPAPAAKGTLLAATSPAYRKQTLLGIAPSEPTKDENEHASEAAASSEPFTPVETAREPLVVPAARDNPLRKQTLLGIAPSTPAAPPPIIASEAPTTLEVERGTASAPVISWPPPAPARTEADDEPQSQSNRTRWLLPFGVAAALVLALFGARQLSRESGSPPTPAPGAPASIAAQPVADNPSRAEKSVPREVEKPTAGVTPEASAASPAGTPSSSSAASSGNVVRVQVSSDPPGARLFWKGKPVGTTPFVLELAPGEKHAYEMGMPGYNTRKVVIDGSKNEVSVGLKAEPGKFIGGGARRKP